MAVFVCFYFSLSPIWNRICAEDAYSLLWLQGVKHPHINLQFIWSNPEKADPDKPLHLPSYAVPKSYCFQGHSFIYDLVVKIWSFLKPVNICASDIFILHDICTCCCAFHRNGKQSIAAMIFKEPLGHPWRHPWGHPRWHPWGWDTNHWRSIGVIFICCRPPGRRCRRRGKSYRRRRRYNSVNVRSWSRFKSHR